MNILNGKLSFMGHNHRYLNSDVIILEFMIHFLYVNIDKSIFYLLSLLFLISSCQSSIEIIQDYEGNNYKTVAIGNQIWMMENLKTMFYLNGEKIRNISENTDWGKTTSGAYCTYKNDTTEIKINGLLYNWYTVLDNRKICPTGWHVPGKSDWIELETYLGGAQIAGGKLKERGFNNWENPNFGATNEREFTALPAGFRHQNGSFFLRGRNACFWSSTQNSQNTSWYRDLDSNDEILGELNNYKNSGLSIRCVKDK